MKTSYLLNKKTLNEAVKLFLFTNLILATVLSFAQQKKTNSIIENFQNYASNYKETTYAQLNKSTYIKGETLGFCGYVIDKAKKTPSLLTKNLYCVITDANNKIVKSKLLKVDKGIAYNSFKIDSLFTTGTYTFKAYTNWMKNFDEPNAFMESFTVIDSEKDTHEKKEVASNLIDAQFLPEGGHFVHNVKTKVGVAVKGANGYGIPYAKGKVYDTNKNLITTFKTNFLGIGNFSLTPKAKQNYIVEINHLDTDNHFAISGVKSKGISPSLIQSNAKVVIELNTNKETLKKIKNKPFKLVIHNGDIIKEGLVEFSETSFAKTIDKKNLLPGVNIFTLFDEDNNPILERLFFNYKDVKTVGLEKSRVSKMGDSLLINIPFEKAVNMPHLSVSVLPKGTKSYQKNHNIVSYTYLQPYVKGYIENGGYYFTNVNREKKHHLDNLLITQGWSSYDWTSIFEDDKSNPYTFENGITVKVNKNNEPNSTFFLSSMKHSNPSIIKVQDNKNYFAEDGLYPHGKEPLRLSALDEKGKLVKPNLYVQFYPQRVPEFNQSSTTTLAPKPLFYSSESKVKPFTNFDLNEEQELDEVTIKSILKKKRFDKLTRDNMMSRVYNVDRSGGNQFLTLGQYINIYVPGFTVREELGTFVVTNRRAVGLSGAALNPNSVVAQDPSLAGPLIIVDDIPMLSTHLLYNFQMNLIDYIVVSPSGMGYGLRGANGVLKIYTKTGVDNVEEVKNTRKFKFPLSFAKNKKFYAPKYQNYHNSFYKEYGVIDWIPNCKFDNNGNLSFKISNPANTNLTLFIEGVTQNGEYITTTKVLNINENL